MMEQAEKSKDLTTLLEKLKIMEKEVSQSKHFLIGAKESLELVKELLEGILECLSGIEKLKKSMEG